MRATFWQQDLRHILSHILGAHKTVARICDVSMPLSSRYLHHFAVLDEWKPFKAAVQ